MENPLPNSLCWEDWKYRWRRWLRTQSLAESYTPCCVLGHELLLFHRSSWQRLLSETSHEITNPWFPHTISLQAHRDFFQRVRRYWRPLLQQIYCLVPYSQHVQRHCLTFCFRECWIKPSGEGTKCRCYWHNTNAGQNCRADRFKHWEMTNVECTNYPVHYFTTLCWV